MEVDFILKDGGGKGRGKRWSANKLAAMYACYAKQHAYMTRLV